MIGYGGNALKFCIEIGHRPLKEGSPHALVEMVELAEAAGVDSVWVSEEPFHWDAYAILGSLATQTSRIRLGPGVTSPYVRPPHLQAMSAATLDRLSQGRAFLGLGRSLTQWYQRLLGMVVGDPVAVMEETIGLLRQWWREPYEAASRGHFNISGLRREVGGVQSHLPIYVAAAGPRMVRLAARLADGVVFTWPSAQFLERTIEAMKKETAAAGRDFKDFTVVVQTGLKVTSDPESALEEFKDQMATIHSIPGLDNALVSSDYDVAQIVAALRDAMKTAEVLERGGSLHEFRQMGDFAAARRAIPTGLVEQVAIVGDAAAVRRRLARYQFLGVTHVFVPAPEDEGLGEYAEMVASISPRPEDF